MPSAATFGLFFTAALILAITPGPGIFYVLTRSIKGGRREGYTSALGTAVGGLFHVVAAALGVSALLATSALAFTVVKYAGAVYLVYLGIRTLLSKEESFDIEAGDAPKTNRAFYQGVLTEMLNPKTALFFLAFIPQFINPNGPVVLEFILLGCISVILNTSVDVIVATLAGPIGQQLRRRVTMRKVQRLFSGWSLIALGGYVALSGGEQQG
jgi:threonine/homoserine/homoserine lactone efflux protein